MSNFIQSIIQNVKLYTLFVYLTILTTLTLQIVRSHKQLQCYLWLNWEIGNVFCTIRVTRFVIEELDDLLEDDPGYLGKPYLASRLSELA